MNSQKRTLLCTEMALPSPSSQPAYPHQQGPLIPSSVFSSDKELQDMVNKRDMRISSTHDLAEFLRCSKPEDYSRPSTLIDDLDLELSSGQRKISFKFLKHTSKELLSPRKTSIPVPVPSTTALPDKVRPEKTSKGNSYLAIQVDYTPVRNGNALTPQVWTPSSSSEDNYDSTRHATSTELSSGGSNYRSSVASQGWKEHDSFEAYSRDDARLSIRWVRNSTGSEMSSSQGGLFASPRNRSHISSTMLSNSRRERKMVTSFPHSLIQQEILNASHANGISDVKSSSGSQRRYSSDSTPRATLLGGRNPKVPSRLYHDDFYTPVSSPKSVASGDEGLPPKTQSAKAGVPESVSKPARPGPPPNRGLPSLPEGHGDAINLASRIRAAAAARSSVGSQISLISEAGSLKNRRSGTLSRSRSEREISVKARKIKDLEESRNRRSISRSEGTYDSDQTIPKSKKQQLRPKKHLNNANKCSFSPIIVVHEVAPEVDDLFEGRIYEEILPVSKVLPRPKSASSVASSEALPSQARISLSLSENICSEKGLEESNQEPTKPTMDNVASLEARIQNMERRNHLLEQALLAVLRGAIYKDSKQETESPGLAEVVKCLADIPAPGYIH